MTDRSRTWDVGYIRKDGKGRDVYIIRQSIGGKQYEVSTRAFSATAAHDQLKRFQADPEGYDPRGDVQPDPVYLDEDLVEKFIHYSREEKENTAKWVREQRKRLAWWAEKLRGVDLRALSLRDDVLPALEKAPGKYARTTVLKGLFSWLRKVRREITLAEDPTAAGGLMVPQPKKNRARASKAVPREQVNLVLSHLAGGWRDALLLQRDTGWHVTEVQRFATSGEIEPPSESQKAAGIAGVLIVAHKSGEQHRTAVSEETLAAAARLRERGGFSVEWYQRAIKSGCKAAGLKKAFGPGVLRHSVATWAVDAGTDLATLSTFLGHKSPRTTKKFYATHATPRNPMLPMPAPGPKVKRRRASSRST